MVNYAAWLKNPAAPRIIIVEVKVKSGGQETTRYLSTAHYVTSPSDTPSNQYYEPVLTAGFQYVEQLDLTGEGGLSGGDVEIANYNGERDSWLNDIWDNRSIVAWIGDPSWNRSDFQMIFNGAVASIDCRSRDTLVLMLRDKMQMLDTPATDSKIGGTGTNKGDVVSLCFGEAHNVTPDIITSTDGSSARLTTYKVHDTTIERFLEVRDNGVPIANDNIGWSKVTRNLSNGTFTLNQSSEGTITASVQGDKNTTFKPTIASLVRRLATSYGTVESRYSSGDIDENNFTSFDIQCSQPVGTFLQGTSNVLLTCQELAASVDARLVTSRLGKLRLIQVSVPGVGTPVEINSNQIVLDSLRISARPFVKASVTLGFNKNYTVQKDLLTGIPDEHKQMFSDEWLTVTSTNNTVKSDYKLNTAPEQTNTLLLRRTDAALEADRRRLLWSKQRTVFQFEGTSDLIDSLELGRAVLLKHHRYGLSQGVEGTVVSLSPNWFTGRIVVGILT